LAASGGQERPSVVTTKAIIAQFGDRLNKLGVLFRSAVRAADESDVRSVDDLSIYDEASKHVVMVTLLEVAPSHVADIISQTKRESRNKVVYVSDCSDFSLFRWHDVMFEYVPSLSQQKLHGAGLAWPIFLNERYELLVAKWRPIKLVEYGMTFARFIEQAEAATGSTPVGYGKAGSASGKGADLPEDPAGGALTLQPLVRSP
jgi:hypothetical protein